MIPNYNYYYYGSADRNRAMARNIVIALQKSICNGNKTHKDMSSDQWMSTKLRRMDVCNGFSVSNVLKGIDVQ
jgi:hypothetical protein